MTQITPKRQLLECSVTVTRLADTAFDCAQIAPENHCQCNALRRLSLLYWLRTCPGRIGEKAPPGTARLPHRGQLQYEIYETPRMQIPKYFPSVTYKIKPLWALQQR
ncbi:hypothetical protein EI94DRAFT_1304648 [Lactarius quietus]|nr:hypothetical protein EI94DRAFT_1304648 [Lactarius quietus]